MSEICESAIIISPPPPPLPNFSVICAVAVSSETVESEEKSINHISKLFSNLSPECDELPSCFKYTYLYPLIQDGPTCGLVALSMIIRTVSSESEVSDLLNLARKRGFTNKGEMFSSINMACLAKEVLSNQYEIINFQGGILKSKDEIISNLLSGNLYLIPYDADKNHSPANLKGLKAHWAILCGIIENASHCYIIARQSKSKHAALWDFYSLHYSNMNLSEISIDKLESGDYITDDIKTSLAGNYILFQKK